MAQAQGRGRGRARFQAVGLALVFVRYQMDLRVYLNQFAVDTEVTKHILRCVLQGLQHTHQNGLVHNDLKPGNIFVQVPANADQIWKSSQQELAAWLFQLPDTMRVVLGDFGLAVPGDPNDRRIQSSKDVESNGVEQATLWYSSVEALCGDRMFSFPVDSWALGCVGAEIHTKEALFPLTRQEVAGDLPPPRKAGAHLVLLKIMRLLGKPTSGPLLELPHFPKAAADFTPQLSHWLWASKDVTKFLRAALTLDPGERLTVDELLQHELLQPRRLEVEAIRSRI